MLQKPTVRLSDFILGNMEPILQAWAEARLLSGYSVEQLVSEYRALRSSVLHLWTSQTLIGMPTDMEDVTRFNEAIDQALAESVARYAQLVKQSENMFLAILGHDLRNPLVSIRACAKRCTATTTGWPRCSPTSSATPCSTAHPTRRSSCA